MNRKKAARGNQYGFLVSALLFVVVLLMLLAGVANLSGGADEEGIAATRRAIERAAVLCYATEGFYPPGLGYIEDNYRVHIDRERYSVRYEVFAYNVTPTIKVTARG